MVRDGEQGGSRDGLTAVPHQALSSPPAALPCRAVRDRRHGRRPHAAIPPRRQAPSGTL
ncbi:MAG: hypothetical protein NVSMB65_12030 [Chloroflexota bacterium]